MKLNVIFKQQNPDFDQKFANEFNGGKESDENRKYLLLESFKVPYLIDKAAVIEKGEIKITGRKDSGENISISIPDMTILECYVGDEVKEKFAVSKELIAKIHKAYNEKFDTARYYIYFKPRTNYIMLTNGIYVIEKDIPEELKKTKE